MTSSETQHAFTAYRPSRPRLTLAVFALLLSLGPLAAQQPSAQAVGDQSPGKPGPALLSSEIAQGAILLHFTNDEGGLRLNGSGRGTFEITGADHRWYLADAHLVSGIVVVSTSLVEQPIAVRYTWHDRAAATLWNGAGSPALPFHTDK